MDRMLYDDHDPSKYLSLWSIADHNNVVRQMHTIEDWKFESGELRRLQRPGRDDGAGIGLLGGTTRGHLMIRVRPDHGVVEILSCCRIMAAATGQL